MRKAPISWVIRRNSVKEIPASGYRAPGALHGLDDHASQPVCMLPDFIEGRGMIEGQDNGILPGAFRKSRALGDSDGIFDGSKRAGIRAGSAEADGQQVMRAMIPTLELGDERPTSGGTRQPAGIHGRLATRVAQAHLIYTRHHVAKQPGKLMLVHMALTIMCPVWQRLPDCFLNIVWRVAEDHGREAKHEVQVFIVIRIPNPGASRPLNHHWERVCQPEDAAHAPRHHRAVTLPDG